MYITTKTIIKMNALLGFSWEGFEQDWAIEFADLNRVEEFILVAQTQSLTSEEKFAIISLILASYDRLLDSTEEVENHLWPQIAQLLDDNFEISNDLLQYWAQWEDERDDNLFAITPMIREYLAKRT